MITAMLTLAVTVAVAALSKGLLRLIPILTGILVGYLLSLAFVIVNFDAVREAPWFAIPAFTTPEWNLQAILFILPIAIAPAIEHIGDIAAIGAVTSKDYFEKLGLHRTSVGDGPRHVQSSTVRGPSNTTYSEVTGAVALTRAFNPTIMTCAAVFAILRSFSGKLGALLQAVPTPVMGGILTLMFGAIDVVGMNTLVRNKEDLSGRAIW